MQPGGPIRGRGAAENPPNRFEALSIEPDLDGEALEGPAPTTQFLRDPSRSIVAHNQSPDVGFDVSVNPYRGCEHGCVYCYARPTHEYLGFSAGLDFETKILVKTEAPRLLRRELASKRWQPQPLAFSGVTDPYQPIERKLELTRSCLGVLAEYRNPVIIVTKNALVARDADLLADLARVEAALVLVSVTTLDTVLHRRMEPRTSRPELRLEAIRKLAQAGVPVGVLAGPMIPGLNDHELPKILEAGSQAGAGFASYIVLRLPLGLKDLFAAWLERHYPDRKQKVLNRVRDVRSGKLNDPRYGSRMRGAGIFADQIRSMYQLACRRNGLATRHPELSVRAFRRPDEPQLGLFDA